MKTLRTSLVLLAAAAVVAGGSLLARRVDRQDTELPPLEAAPSGVEDLLYARPFVLDEGYVHEYRADRPVVRSGWVLVLAVDPELARPRETWNKVLYVGAQTAERVNHGTDSGRIVVLVPSPLDASSEPELDLASAPIFFGGLGLPEQVDAETIERELADARARGVAASPPAQRASARTEGGATLRLADRVALEHELAKLILRYSPTGVDADIARGLAVPPLR